MLQAASTNYDTIALLCLKLGVVRQPAKCTLSFTETMLLGNRSQNIQCIKEVVIEVTAARQFTLVALRVESRAVLELSHVASIPACQEATSQWVKAVK